jgi:hypothetical protein
MSELYIPNIFYNTSLCVGRGIRDHPKAQPRKLAEIWAKRTCGRFNKDIKLFLVGAQGSGKSHSSIHLAIRYAEEVARIKGGTWENYFPKDMSHVFIGDAEEHAGALKQIKKYNVYILDDAGVSINARNFMTTYNKSLNDIFQTVRTDNALIIINAPDSFLIDNVPRNIVSFYGEVSESQHSVGLNFVKIFKLERKFRTGHTHYHHYQFGSQQIIRWRFREIPEDMALAYEKRRDEATQKIKSQAGTGKKDPKTSMKEDLAQKREDVCMRAWQYMRTQEEPTKAKALSRANKEALDPKARIKPPTFHAWLQTSGFI